MLDFGKGLNTLMPLSIRRFVSANPRDAPALRRRHYVHALILVWWWMMDLRVKRVAFIDRGLMDAFDRLKSGRFEDKKLAQHIESAFDRLKQNPSSGVVIRRALWPKEYVLKFGINNLRKYDLPEGWRLIYTLRGGRVEIVSVIIEWFSHKGYEKRFGYKTG